MWLSKTESKDYSGKLSENYKAYWKKNVTALFL